jgi:hypothetical protein
LRHSEDAAKAMGLELTGQAAREPEGE